MAKRDPIKTVRNKAANDLSGELGALLPEVLKATGCDSLFSLNAKIGGKHQELVNVKECCIRTADEFVSLYLDALAQRVRRLPPHVRPNSAYYEMAKWYQTEDVFRKYMEKFLERSFLKHYDAYSRVKPPASGASYWIGETNADYGLLITPRFRNGDWENDKSEIRTFKPDYFTIGHILASGLVVPGKEKQFTFDNIDGYLAFFEDVIVRKAGSKYQSALASRYSDFVRAAHDPEHVPLLIPELRYRGREKLHKHRLDFCVIDPFTLKKIGFELSPWSTHGQLTGTNKKLVKDVNAEALANYEKDVKKCEAYFSDYDIHVTVFTDSDLADPDGLFNRVKRYLTPEKRPQQLLLHSREQLLRMDIDAEVEDE